MYEGYSSMQLTYIAYFSAFMGCKHLIITNSSGGGCEGMKNGSLMVSHDHLAWASKCALPAIYNDTRVGKRHPHSTDGHSPYLLNLALETSKETGIELFNSIYCWTPGPCYETPLETTFLRSFGAGGFGMSTVPEIISAAQLQMDCLVLTMITNLAAGLQGPLNHEEVFEEAKKAGPRLADLITKIILKIDSTRPNHVRIKDEVGESSFFDSYKFRMDIPKRIPINDWIGDALKLWD